MRVEFNVKQSEETGWEPYPRALRLEDKGPGFVEIDIDELREALVGRRVVAVELGKYDGYIITLDKLEANDNRRCPGAY